MDRRKKFQKRVVCRRYEVSRLEDQLWALAYEQVWQLIRKAVNEGRPTTSAGSSMLSVGSAPIARRA
jgi:hypothetical protein